MKKITTSILIASAMLPALCAAQRADAVKGQYQPTWESLSAYETPEWFRDAKFGIWAHWGPQCQPEAGDWYGRGMYEEGSRAYKHHLKQYGHPSEHGFIDVIGDWKAENWNADSLVNLYKNVGAKYFFAMGNHHDNFDMWDSKYQPWNSVNMGPRRDILDEWEKAARKNGLPFGVSIHSSHAWTWYETGQRADTIGPKAGISYDARVLTKEDGKGKWWEGYDPQELYVQKHSLSPAGWTWWDWSEGTSVPTQEYLDNFYNRTTDMITRYNPDLIYFDDSVVPFWPIDNTGLDVVADYYNHNAATHNGEVSAVVFGKKLDDTHKDAIVWDVEKGIPPVPQEKAWQTCTCLGQWHYDRSVYDDNWYKTPETVVKMLIDIVSKNGNLLLSVPMRGDGTIDDKESAILDGIKAWLDINGEGIFGTRPWSVYGEGPSTKADVALDGAGFNESKMNFTSADIRYVKKGDHTVYAHVMAWPDGNNVVLKSLGKDSGHKVKDVKLLGAGKVKYRQTADGLVVTLPGKRPNDISPALKITLN